MSSIAVIEDHAPSRKLLTDVLETAGYRVLSAENAETGIAMIREAEPDLILMDIQMPGMDGLTAIRLLKADFRTAKIPIIAVSALAMEGDRERILASGCEDYTSKPIRYKELLGQIQRMLQPT
ncbi:MULTISPECIES: response regulator [Methylomonas]|uniref:response regulator n=1 Tax=Methylomonas TaxID=416 RepID=UPI001232DC83|nr:response regulator [Methylomonas rhizoryzae]